MSVKITDNVLYVKDANGNLSPLAMVGSGADKTLTQINTYATAQVTSAKAEIDAKVTSANTQIETKGATTLASIPADYTTLTNTVSTMGSDLANLQNCADGTITKELKEDVYDLLKNTKVEYIGTIIANENKFWNAPDTLASADGWYAYAKIKVYGGLEYYYSGFEWSFSWYRKNSGGDDQKPFDNNNHTITFEEDGYVWLCSFGNNGQSFRTNFTSKEIADLQSDVTNLDEFTNQLMKTNYNNLAIGENVNKFWQSPDNCASADGWIAFDKIKVAKGIEYYYDGVAWTFSWYRKNSGGDTFQPFVDNNHLVTFEEDGYVWLTSWSVKGCFRVNDANDIPDNATITVGNGCDYSTLKEALCEAVKHKNVSVYVKDGTYDLFTEFCGSESEFEETVGSLPYEDAYKYQYHLYNGVKLFFSANSKVTANYNGNNSNVNSYISVFANPLDYNADHNFEIHGLNLECKNIRYAIHDDTGGAPKAYTHLYKNCNVTIDNSNNSNWRLAHCIGGGLGTSSTIIIDNCVFNGVVQNNDSDVHYHQDNVPSHNNSRSDLYISNSYFAKTFGLGSMYTHDRMSVAYLNNCSFSSEPFNTSHESNPDNTKLMCWNNEIRSN